jgi:hypothetical protein
MAGIFVRLKLVWLETALSCRLRKLSTLQRSFPEADMEQVRSIFKCEWSRRSYPGVSAMGYQTFQ